jgi:hypothetical protein
MAGAIPVACLARLKPSFSLRSWRAAPVIVSGEDFAFDPPRDLVNRAQGPILT